MTKPRALIVDDEPLARERLQRLLQRQNTVELAGECGDGPDALATIERERPDIVFLDVQMPGCSGLDVANQLPATARPAIIFVTAHERFAVEAFAARAVDYLLKPFDEERLHQAVERALELLQSRQAREVETRLESILAQVQPRVPERIAVRVDGRIVFVKPREVVWIEAANNYCVLHLTDAPRLMLRESLGSVEQRLGAANFARISRSAVVRSDQIKELESANYGEYVVVLLNGTRLPLSRYRRNELERALTEAR
ncbi:LytR/AlgR family response regulator transcription factor [Opitutus terrae]|uniref:Two component transcriptional regulator, LytTR family n=1 Tax=Opitutus terrae (strain DSM 11246 / JCM 15787 / PB90-1) TaxID=452637 RepID=B1ZQK1_OPITP|nr:LytTR family DNA-binding domain-containing protein [Opitutus terrae]ACB75610.1 two component transcriptional regulator, LytTR family [Opitutus terrae PB90-1]